jgi:hypothetical protein
MRTEELIDLLSRDSSSRWGLKRTLITAAGIGVMVAATLFFSGIGFRPDIAEAVQSTRFLFKFVVTISLAVAAIDATLRLGRPDGDVAHKVTSLLAVPVLLICAVTIELIVVPENQWMFKLVGHNSRSCLTLIPLLSIGPLICFLIALRQGAPERPGLAGAVSGLAAGGIAATFYAANCNDDSPLFVATWYSIAILMVAVAGGFAGRKLLRW